MSSLHDRIALRRFQLGLSLAELGRLTGIPKSTLAGWEGGRSPRLCPGFYRLLKVLEISWPREASSTAVPVNVVYPHPPGQEVLLPVGFFLESRTQKLRDRRRRFQLRLCRSIR